MSSLANQLSSIAQANQAVALDRKKRSKIHSVSLLHEPHFASTQDYETIYEDAFEALDRLESFDNRFGKFKYSIFSQTSIRIDRQVQTKEENDNLNKTIDTFLSLLAPYWDLAIAARAAEWPLRRFQMNIYNSEQLLLTTLPYFNKPVFPRILYSISKLPTLFTWLGNFKKANNNPSKNTMVKAFTDVDIFNLYTKFLQEQLSRKNQFRRQLAFYVSMTVSSLSTLSSTGSDKLPAFVSYTLESVSSFLASPSQEAKISAYTILAVVASAVPLSKEVVMASIETVLLSASGKDNKLSSHAFTCIIKVFGSIQSGALNVIPERIYSMLPSGIFDGDYPFVQTIKSSRSNAKFVTAYLRTMIANKKEINIELLKIIQDIGIEFNEVQVETLLNEAIKIILENKSDDLSIYVNILKFFAKHNLATFKKVCSDLNIEINELEMIIQSILVQADFKDKEDLDDVQVNIETISDIVDEDIEKIYKENVTMVNSYLELSDLINTDYNTIESLFLKSIQTRTVKSFLNIVFGKNLGSVCSFLVRVASSNVPLTSRIYAIQLLGQKFVSFDENTFGGLLYPAIITLLVDDIPQIRKQTGKLLKKISESNTKKDAKNVLLAGNIYNQSSNPVALSPVDSAKLISLLVENIPHFNINSEYLPTALQPLMTEKKLGKVYLAYFTTHASQIEIPAIKMKLINIIAQIAAFVKGAAAPSELFEEFLSVYVEDYDKWNQACIATSCDFTEFHRNILSLIRSKEKNATALKFLHSILSISVPSIYQSNQDKIMEIFPTLKFEAQVKFSNHIIDEGLADNTVLYDPTEILESVNLSGDIFVELFKGCSLHSDDSQLQGQTPKRRRRSSQSTRHAMKGDEVSTLASDHLKKVTMLLDLLDIFSKKGNFEPSFELLRLLFGILDDLETLGKDGKLPILYAQETIASCLKNIIQNFKDSGISIKDTSVIRADVVVSAIRSSDSPQVQNKLLLVIASLASLCPELILHSVMPIFTFMGAHTIRQDDEFSGHVVEQTIVCVVPALANAAQNGMIDEIEFLLASFVSAFLHIPRHRRVRLFTTLARTLGPEYSVHLILFLCGQQYVEAYMKHKMGDCSAVVDFASVFLQNFKPKEELAATMKFFDLWKIIPDTPLNSESDQFKELCSRVIFGPNLMAMSKSDLYSLRKGMASFIRHALTDAKSSSGVPKLRLKIASSIVQGEDTDDLLTKFSQLTKYILDMISISSATLEDDEIIKKFYKLLDDVLSLLPIEYFVKSVDQILNDKSTSLPTLKNLVLLTASKFNMEHTENPYAHEGIHILIPTLLEKITLSVDVELSQACLDTLANIFQRFNESVNSSSMINVLGKIIGECGLINEESPELTISSINCITSIVSVVGVKMIGLFPKIMPTVLKIFDDCVGSDQESAKLIQISILVLFSTMVKKIPNFLTPNIKDILNTVYRARSISDSIRMNIMETIVEYVDSKIVLTSLCNLWGFVSNLDATSLGLYLNGLENVIEKMNKKTAVSEAGLFFRFLVNALEYRAISKFDVNAIGRVEASIHSCGLAYVMKLNDKTFRPLFASIVRWAFDGEGSVTDISSENRLESFFKFFNRMQESLRSIITTYHTYIMDSTELLLNKFSSGEMNNVSLRRSILISLASSFKYDQTEFWQTNSRYDPISKALTNQLGNIDDAIGKHLVKALTYLVQTTCSSDEHNKHMNELLMQHMRAECKPREKYWAVSAMKNIYKKVGEAWLSLLPQMVPLIAELLEDDDEDVEMEVRTGLAKVLEEVMGEPLDRYLE